MQTTLSEISIRDRGIAFTVFGFLLACYLLTYTGVIQSSDGLAMFATGESIVRRGEVDANQLLWMSNQQGNLGPDGDLYSRKGLGMTLLAVPLIWVAKLTSSLGLVQSALLLNPVLTAWTGGLLFRAGRRLGWSRNTSVAVALIFGLATLAWPYTQTFFSDPVCGFGLAAGFYGILSFSQSGRKRYLLVGALAWGLAYLARVINLLTLPIYLAAVVVAIHHTSQHVPRLIHQRQPEEDNRSGYIAWLGRNWRPLVTFLVPIIIVGLLSLWWNWARYGSIWESGYVETERFSAVWWFGIMGLLVGPARGLLWYSPALLLIIPSLPWFWQRGRLVLGVCLSITLLYVLVYGKWYMWHGGYSWGPRFLVPTLLFLVLLTGPGWEQWVVENRWGIGGRIIAILLVTVSVIIQWLGLLVPFGLVQERLASVVEPLYAPETFTQLAHSPLLLQWQFLRPEEIHLAWWNHASSPWMVDWLGLLIPLMGIVVGVLLLNRQLRDGDMDRNMGGSVRGWLYGITLCILALVLLLNYDSTLSDPEMRQVARRIEEAEEVGDAILHLRPEVGQAFANVYHGELPLFGLFAQDNLGQEEEGWLDRLQQEQTRLWLVPDQSLPEQSGWERPLRMEGYLLLDTRVSEPEGQRLALYALADQQELVEAGLGTVFGDPALVESGITEENGWIRLEGYALTPETRPGDVLLLSLRWKSLRPVDYDYQVFVHLLNTNDEKLAQRDGQPVQWMRPTSTWQEDEEIIDHYGLLLSKDLPVGTYTIAVGLYDPISGQRLPVSAGPRDYAIELGPISVVE